MRASKRIFKPETSLAILKQLKQSADNDAEFIGVPSENTTTDNNVEMNDVEKLREENKRLKRTLLERFQAEYK